MNFICPSKLQGENGKKISRKIPTLVCGQKWKKLWNIRVIVTVVWALGKVPMGLERGLKNLKTKYVPEWITKRKFTLIQKGLLRRTAPNNYIPITYLHIMWKILIAQIREELFDLRTNRGLLPEENMKKTIISIVISALVTVNKWLISEVENMEIRRWVDSMQTSA